MSGAAAPDDARNTETATSPNRMKGTSTFRGIIVNNYTIIAGGAFAQRSSSAKLFQPRKTIIGDGLIPMDLNTLCPPISVHTTHRTAMRASRPINPDDHRAIALSAAGSANTHRQRYCFIKRQSTAFTIGLFKCSTSDLGANGCNIAIHICLFKARTRIANLLACRIHPTK